MAKKRIIKVNMKGVEAGGFLVPEDDYKITPVAISEETGSDSGKNYLAWEFEIVEGKYKGKTLYYNTSLQPQALWNLRGVLEAFGVEVPDSMMELDLSEIEGDTDLVAGCTVEHEKYEGKNKARIADIFPADAATTVEETAEAGVQTDEVPSEEDVNAMDDSDLQEVIDAFDLDVDLEKVKLTSKKRRAVNEALEEKRNPEPEAETTDVPTRDDVENADEDELETIVEAHDLEVDLSKLKTLAKKQAAVADALEEKGNGVDEAPDIQNMGSDELAAFVKEHKLKVKLDGSLRKRRRIVLKAAQEAEIVVAE